ncbi:serine/threonine-protein kinase M1 [Lecanora helva]
MVRGVGRSGARCPVPNEVPQNGDAPQSTLAAQLVNQLADIKTHPKHQDRETFRQLLREILGSKSDSHDVDRDVSYKIIYVVVKAGLETLLGDGPFDKRAEIFGQAVDSLAAVESTLTRNPDVLYTNGPAQGPDLYHHGPLFLWLIIKLLTIAGQVDEEAIIDGIIRLLNKVLFLEKKTHIGGVKKYTILKYMKGCFRDLLSSVELSTIDSGGFQRVPETSIPSDLTLSGVLPDLPLQNGSTKIIQIQWSTRLQALKIGVCLLNLFSTVSPVPPGSVKVKKSAFAHPNWILNSMTRFWRSCYSEALLVDAHLTSSPTLAIFLNSMHNLLTDMSGEKKCAASLANKSRFVLLFAEILKPLLRDVHLPMSASTETALCLLLGKIVTYGESNSIMSQNFSEYVVPQVAAARASPHRFENFGPELQDQISLLCNSNQPSVQRDPGISHFQSKDDEQLRPHKRARLCAAVNRGNSSDVRVQLITGIHELVNKQGNHGLSDLSEVTRNVYPNLSEDKQCSLHSSIGLLACASAQSLESSTEEQNIKQMKCQVCDNDSNGTRTVAVWEGHEADEAFSTIANLVKLSKAQKSRRPRVTAMLALRRLLSHTGNADHLNLADSQFGQWCLQALHSSIRELRIAAGRTLSTFVQYGCQKSVLAKNCIVALDCLRSLSEQRSISVQETCVLAWGQIARISAGDEMNLVLLRLVEYLGNTNPLLSGLAYDELQRLSNHSPFSAMKLFAPYWRTVAVTVAQDLHRRPQIAQQISDLLALSVSDFLCLTQVHTVPFFVLTKKQDVLQRIANACGTSIMALCREHNNLAAILSCVLLKSPSDAEGLVISLLNAVSPEFNNVDCAELLRSEPQATASELLKAAGEVDGVKKSRAHQALEFLASVTHNKPSSSRGSARKIDVVGPFFETHVLGIMALLADTINDGKGPQPILEKIRCLGAIHEMIKLAKNHISNGLPQICACLRSAIENSDLSNQGLDAWIVMMSSLGEDEIVTLVDPTFAVLIQYWDLFAPELQTRAYDMISNIMKTNASMIRDIVHTLPSLASIPLMAKFEEDLRRLKDQMDVKHHFQAFSQRCQNENATVVLRALDELARYLADHQDYLHETANSDQPEPVVAQLTRSLLDVTVLFSNKHLDIAILCARCLGFVGCLDPTRIEAIKEKREIIVLSNFQRNDETNDFVVFFLREVLVKAFLSATNSRSQGFLAYAMQELLSISELKDSVRPRSRDGSYDPNYGRWASLPESIRTTLMPFVNSKYFVTAGISQPPCVYPLYTVEMNHGQWLRTFTFDLLKRPCGEGKAPMIFSVLSRIVRFQDISISNFLLPFACVNVIINGTDQDRLAVGHELHLVLQQPLPDNGNLRDNIVLCSQTVFAVLDYLSRWMQEKRIGLASARNSGTRVSRSESEVDLERDTLHISRVDAVLTMIPADVISRRATECKSFARALFHWEQFIRQQREQRQTEQNCFNLEALYERLQEIYTQIDEPDGIEGISSHLHILNIDQQILEHRKAGRWTAAQSWYELQLKERPNDIDVQYNLLTSLRESGQHDVLLNQIEGFQQSEPSNAMSLTFATEAAWATGKWEKLRQYLSSSAVPTTGGFNVGVGQALLALLDKKPDVFSSILDTLRQSTASSLSTNNTASLQGCHDSMLKLHVLAEMETISGIPNNDQLENQLEKSSMRTSLNLRLDALGPFLSDKQYILGLRRAVMELSWRNFSKNDIASTWLTSAKLARKSGFTHQAFNAVMHASELGDDSAMIEHSRLLWREGNHRKAIQSLEGAIAGKAFRSHDFTDAEESLTTNNPSKQMQQNLLTARAHLLLAKWIDRAGQTQSDVIIQQYRNAVEHYNRWEKGYYYLGKHYNKLFESEKMKPPSKQSQLFINGETAKLVIENYLRSLAYGAKYIYQTLPRLLTLWLDLGSATEEALDPKYGCDETFRVHITAQRRKLLNACNSQIKKYADRLPAFVFYTALSQLVARICHPNQSVYTIILDMVAKVVYQHTPQALWTVLAVVKSSTRDRSQRGTACITRALENARKGKADGGGTEFKTLVAQGQKLADQLLHVCEAGIEGKPSTISISHDLGFKHRTAPCKLAIPLEQSLVARLPTVSDTVIMKQHKAFNAKDYIHISSFLDEAQVLNSLQKPRKISIRGSDGHLYALLCKPKDDLRKDQRLMEFNAMINRALKKDAESSKRRLYIKTYAVTPLNEECGLIEWIDNLRTLRDILLAIYKQKSVPINYAEIRTLLNESISTPSKLPIFTDRIIRHFPPVFHEWFVEMFPEPGAWFTARLRYTRSCAVMSIVGHVLGLGDRHGENILFEEGNGGTFHVDFNCLFDKGLTFEKPELVPFRLTHNMVDAFGAYGYEGPFRKSCELTLGILRQHEDTLMTILETFLYDPTTDFIGGQMKKKKKKAVSLGVPDTPEGVLEGVQGKVRGLLPGESVPLSVEGYVQALIQQAVDPFRLASMYIGWCPFF